MRTVIFKGCIILSLHILFQHYGELSLVFDLCLKVIIFLMLMLLLHIVGTFPDC